MQRLTLVAMFTACWLLSEALARNIAEPDTFPADKRTKKKNCEARWSKSEIWKLAEPYFVVGDYGAIGWLGLEDSPLGTGRLQPGEERP